MDAALKVLILCTLAGFVLGWWWRVFILIPAMLATWASIAALGLHWSMSGWDLLFCLVAASIGLQIGYFIGMLSLIAFTTVRTRSDDNRRSNADAHIGCGRD